MPAFESRDPLRLSVGIGFMYIARHRNGIRKLAHSLSFAMCLGLIVCSDPPTGPRNAATVQSIRSVARGHFPDVSKNRVVWQEFTGGPLYVADLSTGERRLLAEAPETGQVDRPAIWGRRLTWTLTFVVDTGFSPSGITLGDVAGADTTLISGPGVDDQFSDISQRYVAWERRGANGTQDVMAYDMERGEIIAVATGPTSDRQPAVDHGRVVYARSQFDDDGELTTDIVLFDLATRQARRLSPNSGWFQGHPDISGDVVVWVDGSDETSDIVYRDLSSGEYGSVTGGRGNATLPSISRKLIVWTDARNGEREKQGLEENRDIFGFDLEYGDEFPITTAPGLQDNPEVSGDYVVWDDWSGGSPRVFVAEVRR